MVLCYSKIVDLSGHVAMVYHNQLLRRSKAMPVYVLYNDNAAGWGIWWS